MSLGRSHLDKASPLTITPEITWRWKDETKEADVEIDDAAGTVRRLRDDLPRGPYIFTYWWNDTNAEDAAQEAALAIIRASAEPAIEDIPGYAHWPEDQADSWFQTNLRDPLNAVRAEFVAATTMAEMKVAADKLVALDIVLADVEWKIARMIIAFRNREFPNLQNEE